MRRREQTTRKEEEIMYSQSGRFISRCKTFESVTSHLHQYLSHYMCLTLTPHCEYILSSSFSSSRWGLCNQTNRNPDSWVLMMDQSNKYALIDRGMDGWIRFSLPVHSSSVSAKKDQTDDMGGCALHLGRNCVQSDGCNVNTPGPCHSDDRLFSEFGSKF